jgi:hypothetical protein
MSEVDPRSAHSAEELQEQWHAALRRHGIEPRPNELGITAKVWEAANGPLSLKPARYARIVMESLSGIRRFFVDESSDDRR